MEGWVKLHRKLQENPLWTCEPFTRGQAWIDLILLANHKDSFFYKRNVKINVKRGQVGRSEVELSDRWKWSRSKVRKFLKDLEKEQQVAQQKTNVTQLLTIVNYDLYQQKEQQDEHQKNTKKTAREHQEDTYKNDKKKKNDNNEIKESVFSFDEFWKMYPKKIQKQDCVKKYEKINEKDRQKIKDTLNKFIKHKPFETYTHPNPAAYLNQKRWDDELTITSSQQQKPRQSIDEVYKKFE